MASHINSLTKLIFASQIKKIVRIEVVISASRPSPVFGIFTDGSEECVASIFGTISAPPEDGGSIILQNRGKLLSLLTASRDYNI
jgi:hypothetical protein